jgi:hypothetical protein
MVSGTICTGRCFIDSVQQTGFVVLIALSALLSIFFTLRYYWSADENGTALYFTSV